MKKMVVSNLKFLLGNIRRSIKFIISKPNLMIKLNLCLKTINYSLIEYLSILKYKYSKQLDKQFLYTLIKRNAHLVENLKKLDYF